MRKPTREVWRLREHGAQSGLGVFARPFGKRIRHVCPLERLDSRICLGPAYQVTHIPECLGNSVERADEKTECGAPSERTNYNAENASDSE